MGEIKILLSQFTFVKKQKPVAWVMAFLLERKRRKIPGDQPQEERKKFFRRSPFAAWPRVFLHKQKFAAVVRVVTRHATGGALRDE